MPERILQLTPGSISQQWYEDGAAVDPGTVTIGITRADGTVVVAPATATTGSGTGARSFALTTTHTALLDQLTATWTSSAKGTLKSYIEVVGGFLFPLTQLQTLLTSSRTTQTFTTAQLADARLLAETALEDACAVAFVPRYSRELVSGNGRTTIPLTWPRVRSIRSVAIAGTTISATFTPYIAGSVYYASYWTAGYKNITIGYEHGYDYPPARVTLAALTLAKMYAIEGPIDDRTTSMSTDLGVFSLATPGMRGSTFGVPEVDAVVQQYGEQPIFA